MTDILKLARVQILVIVVFMISKMFRNKIVQSAAPEFLKIIWFSLPSFFEAFTGSLVLTGLGLIANSRLAKSKMLKSNLVYCIAVISTGIYTTLQELNIITLRSNNTIDKFDIIFSCLGLILGFVIIKKIQPQVVNGAPIVF